MLKKRSGYSKKIVDILPSVMRKIDRVYAKKPVRVLEVWPMIIGEKLAPFTKAVSLENGILTVKVKNSTLLSLLSREEKNNLLIKLQKKFSRDTVRNINFRIG